MNLEKIKILENISKVSSFENYFETFPNFCFTSLNLKQKRILSFFLRKIIMIPKYRTLSFEILSYFLKTFEKNEKIEQNLCDFFERIFAGKPYAFNNMRSLYNFFFKINKKNYNRRFYFLVKLINLFLLFDQKEEAKSLLANQNYEYDNLNNPKFTYLTYLFGLEIDWENLFNNINRPEATIIIDYSDFLIKQKKIDKAFEFLQKYWRWDGIDNFLIKKQYLKVGIQLNIIFINDEIYELIICDLFDYEYIEIALDYLLLKNYSNNFIFQIFWKFFEFNIGSESIWKKFKDFLEINSTKITFNSLIKNSDLNEFISLHLKVYANKIKNLEIKKEIILLITKNNI